MLREDSILKTLNLLVLVVLLICSCTNNVDIDEFMAETLMVGMPVPERDPIILFLDEHADHAAHEFPKSGDPTWYTCTHYSTNTTQKYIVIAAFIDGNPQALATREYFPGLMDRIEFEANIKKAIAKTQKAAEKPADAEEYSANSMSTEFTWYLGDEYVYTLQPYPETRMIQYILMHQ